MNGFELQAREKKARMIADILQGERYSSSTVAGFDEHQWSLAAAAARQKFPSPETQGMVIKMLRQREDSIRRNYATT